MRHTNLQYVLITPARNEALFIEKVLQSVLSQTRLPRMWVIVSDNSSDQTSEIASKYARDLEWIVIVNAHDTTSRPFPSKVYGFDIGYDYVIRQRVEYDLIGSLDADISFPADYFEYLLDRFSENPVLGIAGTDYVETGFHSARDTKASRLHVNGQCQLFRKECFEDIGGYTPIEFFGEDVFAVTTAKYLGWQTRSFSERVFVHNRPMGSRDAGSILGRFTQGRQDYIMGNGILWQCLRALYWTKNRPYGLGGLMLFLGYMWSLVRGNPIRLSPQVLRMYRSEQHRRLNCIYHQIRAELSGKAASNVVTTND